MAGLTLDAGVLISAGRNERKTWALIREANRRGEVFTIPAAVLAQVWREPPEVRMARLVGNCNIDSLDERSAKEAGALAGRAGVADAVDASVVVSASHRGDAVVTGDIGDLGLLAEAAGGVRMIPIPR